MTFPAPTGPRRSAEGPIRILIVDDSAFMRFTIAKRLNETPGMKVVGAARDGQEALTLIPTLQPDVVTLDVEMPRMDGLTTLRAIMANFPRPVIMLSSLTTDGARETVQALTLGAVDFIAKPTAKANVESIMEEVIAKIQRAAGARVRPAPVSAPPPTPRRAEAEARPNPPAERRAKVTRPMQRTDRIVVIGSSTGGPRALNTVVPQLAADLPATFLIVQHMPVGFTRSLAERLDGVSKLAVKEAAPGDTLEVGRCLLAPGGYHMTLDTNGQIALNQNPPVHGVRPSVDVTMNSVVQRFGALTVGVVLTGMGSDGTNGASLIHASGGHIIAEDESTCVVWGMPRSVAEAGAADVIAPLTEVAAAIERALR
jgi:two-component system chemotaxis response regulator CheB